MARHLTNKQQVDIVTAYTINLDTVIQLSKRYNLTRQGVYKVLKRQGVDIATCGRIAVSCAACNNQFKVARNRIRKQKKIFCSMDCYYAFLEAGQGGTYKQSRHGQRLARIIAAKYFDIQPGNIVHHKDRNTLHNSPSNLMIFANQGDHVRWHRGGKDNEFDVKPLWDG